MQDKNILDAVILDKFFTIKEVTPAEIAEQLDITESTVKRTLQKYINNLDVIYEKL